MPTSTFLNPKRQNRKEHNSQMPTPHLRTMQVLSIHSSSSMSVGTCCCIPVVSKTIPSKTKAHTRTSAVFAAAPNAYLNLPKPKTAKSNGS
jgi:hypothetical protein